MCVAPHELRKLVNQFDDLTGSAHPQHSPTHGVIGYSSDDFFDRFDFFVCGLYSLILQLSRQRGLSKPVSLSWWPSHTS
jgi:hypothetical protein